MPNEINHSRTRNSSFYDQKYGSGNGWKYDTDKVTRWLQESIVSRFGLTPGDRVLELGCGEGHHSALLASFGLDVYGVDFSEKGIEAAKERGFWCDIHRRQRSGSGGVLRSRVLRPDFRAGNELVSLRAERHLPHGDRHRRRNRQAV